MRNVLFASLLGVMLVFQAIPSSAETMTAQAPEVRKLIERARTALVDGNREVFVVVIAKMHFLMTGQALEEKIDPTTAPAEYGEGVERFQQVINALMSGTVLEKLRDEIRLLGLSAAFEEWKVDTYLELKKEFSNCAKDPDDMSCPIAQQAIAWVDKVKMMSSVDLRAMVAEFMPEQRPGVPLKTLSSIRELLLKQAHRLETGG
ncbi:MAG: hypothetical protein JKY27_12240 [Magnetovibrio sp.]|nr:hypothetical protein [Magnetovibrio sp.]